MGDFTGFTFGDWHSSDSESGLVTVLRVSGGDRYEEELHPEIKDVTAEVPGMDGEYYFGSSYGPKKIDIEIAFDSLTEVQFRELRKVFGTKKQEKLIFDERPYKKYMAKLESPIQLSYVCFDEPKKVIGAERDGVKVASRTTNSASVSEAVVGYSEVGNTTSESIITREKVTPYVMVEGQCERIYKGEGKISFICYFPFAKSVYKKLSTEESNSDWAISSGILSIDEYEENNIDEYNSETGIITLYNPGDIETGFRLYIPLPENSNKIPATTLNYTFDYNEGISDITASLVLKEVTIKNDDIGILIDTNNSLILGVSDFYFENSGNARPITSGNIYNEFIEAGYFFKIKPNILEQSVLEVIGAVDVEIFYDYLYF